MPLVGAPSAKWSVALLAALAQLGAAAITFGLARWAGAELPGFALVLIHSALAAALAWRLGMPWWWLPIQFLFVPMLLAALMLEIAPAWFLAAFVLLALVYWSTYRTRVPLYLSGEAVWQALAGMLPRGEGAGEARILDLGSGLGGPLAYLAKRHPELRFEGIEAAPLPFLISRLRALGRDNLAFRFGSFWSRSLSGHDLVFAFLSPAAMPRLWQKVKAEMRPGSVFVSVEFAVPGVTPDRVLQIGEGARARLYVWQF